MKKNDVSTGTKVGYGFLVVMFAAIGGFFGFLVDQAFRIGGIHSSSLQVTLILSGVLIALTLVIMAWRSSAKEGKRRLQASGTSADSGDTSFLFLVAAGSGSSEGGSNGGWFSGGSDGGGGGGDSGGGGGGGGD